MAKVLPSWSKRITSSSSMSPVVQAGTQLLKDLVFLFGRSCVQGNRGLGKLVVVKFGAIMLCGRRKLALDEIVLVLELPSPGRDHLAVSRKNGRRRSRQVVLDRLMELGEVVVRHHREHVVLDVVVHVEIEEPADWV